MSTEEPVRGLGGKHYLEKFNALDDLDKMHLLTVLLLNATEVNDKGHTVATERFIGLYGNWSYDVLKKVMDI
jgi:hypothetical protein